MRAHRRCQLVSISTSDDTESILWVLYETTRILEHLLNRRESQLTSGPGDILSLISRKECLSGSFDFDLPLHLCEGERLWSDYWDLEDPLEFTLEEVIDRIEAMLRTFHKSQFVWHKILGDAA